MAPIRLFGKSPTLRFELTIIVTLVIFAANAALSVATILLTRDVHLRRVQDRVRLDLNSARRLYNQQTQGIRRYLEGVAVERAFIAESPVFENGVAERLRVIQESGGLDICALLDNEGKVLVRANNPALSGDSLADHPLVRRVLETRAAAEGSVLLTEAELLRESARLAAQARFEILPTAGARPDGRGVETGGMVVAVAAPILTADGRMLGVLLGANLLNRRHEVVDQIKSDLFQNESYEGRDMGSATIFQGDLRIATNVLRRDGSRAVGTRMSAEVYDRVIAEGGSWFDRAFVVDGWWITAYEPIRDPDGRVIGSLYVGLLEAPFQRSWRVIAAAFLGTTVVITALSVVLIVFVARQILRPIGRVVKMSRRVVAGDLTARVELRPAGEMGQLCEAIDQMAEAVMEREERLKEATSRQVSQSEKLASIGRLAAGIAHEINNPLGAVVTMSHLLREKIGQEKEDIEDLDLIIHETSRVSEIVKGLLDFSRESPAEMRPLDMGEVIATTLKLVRGDKSFRHVDMRAEIPPEGLPLVSADRNQMQQVLVNLCINACQAMPDQGTLTIRAFEENRRLKIQVIDTGCGVPRELFNKIFEPFFTTKPAGKGTGLGLSVTYGIVEKHGGHIEVESEVGKGSVFTVVLPLHDPAMKNAGAAKTA
jgi:two-component system NtrC family sensor kinase